MQGAEEDGSPSRGGSTEPTAGIEIAFSSSVPPELPGYQIISKISEGGQGVVCKALQLSTKRVVAIKYLRDASSATDRQRKRFEREVRLAASLKHPNIVTVFDSNLTPGSDYIIMEYIRGVPLNEYVSKPIVGMGEVLSLFAKTAEAVSFAHEAGVVHRDLKPSNILVDEAGEPHILDFGLAKSAGMGERFQASITVTSEFIGTPMYASPEQTRGDAALIDARTDTYSLGFMFYSALTGRPPYEVASDRSEMFHNINFVEPVRPSRIRPEIGKDLDTIVLRALAKDSQRRYPTIIELARDIRRVIAGAAIKARPDNAIHWCVNRARALGNRFRAAALIVILAGSIVLSQSVGLDLVFKWTPLNSWFEHLATVVFAAEPFNESFEHVRVIAVKDETDMAGLAKSCGVDGVANDRVKSWRRLHGKLMEKLVDANIGVLCWDIMFKHETEYDADFAHGAEKLRNSGAESVVAIGDWHLRADGTPELSRTIAPSVGWGVAAAPIGPSQHWWLHLALKRGLHDAWPSLALATIAKFRQPGAIPWYRLNPAEESIDVTFTKESGIAHRVRKPIGNPIRINVTGLRYLNAGDPRYGLLKDDFVAHFRLHIPPDNFLEDSTIEYGRVFNASTEEKKTWLNGKTVIVADMRSGIDRHGHPDGRNLPGAYAHAAGIDAMLSAMQIRFTSFWHNNLLSGVAALLALLASKRMPRGFLAFAIMLTAVAASALIGAVLVYRTIGYLSNPFVPVITFLLVYWLARMVLPTHTYSLKPANTEGESS